MNNNGKQEQFTSLFQRWGAGKISIGSKYLLDNKIITLIKSDGYSNGNFVFDDGTELSPGKYFKHFVTPVVEEKEIIPSDTIFNEEVWNEFDDAFNPKKSNGEDISKIIRHTSIEKIKNNKAFDKTYIDVTEIFKKLFGENEKDFVDINREYIDIIVNKILDKKPISMMEKLALLICSCDQEDINDYMTRLYINGEKIADLLYDNGKWYFAPIKAIEYLEYEYYDNKPEGFFFTAEAVLNLSLKAIGIFKKINVPIYRAIPNRNFESLEYHADSIIKSLLSFSCECYLKALLLNNNKNLNEVKKLGHGLSTLFTSLSDDEMTYIFEYMKSYGYSIDEKMYYSIIEAINIEDYFMLDLAKVDDAFVESRYSAESDKNTDYSFLYRFAFAIRDCTEKTFNTTSIFATSIEEEREKYMRILK